MRAVHPVARSIECGRGPRDMPALPGAAWRIRAHLFRERPMGEVADAMCCDPSNVTTMIDRLQGRGLVERTPGSEDRRVKVLSLTPEGRALLRKVDQELERRLLPEDVGPRTVATIRRMRRLLGGSG
jgi:DNA-binding MarR family transcriptional regulator